MIEKQYLQIYHNYTKPIISIHTSETIKYSEFFKLKKILDEYKHTIHHIHQDKLWEQCKKACNCFEDVYIREPIRAPNECEIIENSLNKRRVRPSRVRERQGTMGSLVSIREHTSNVSFKTLPVKSIEKQISPTRTSHYRPISRAFYKLWEIIHDFKLFSKTGTRENPDTSLCYGALAEGPGGFVEAFHVYRSMFDKGLHRGDKAVCISIRPSRDNQEAPTWSKAYRVFKNLPGIHYEYGADGTGDILQPNNIDHYCQAFQEHTKEYGGRAHFVTGDGGFDFSQQFSEQDHLAFPLILAQKLSHFVFYLEVEILY